MPAVSATASTGVLDARWITIGQAVYMFGIGYLFPTAVTLVPPLVGPAGLVTFQNPAVMSGVNAAPGTNAALNAKVSPAGYRGATGASPSVNLNLLSPTTTKGDILADNGANSPTASLVALGIGTNGKVLTADSTQPTGLNYKAVDVSGVATAITGVGAIANGMTGQSTKTAAFDALSPLTTAGDIIYRNGSNNVRLPIGAALQQLRTNAGATAPEWFTPVVTSQVAQMVSASNNAYSNGLTVIPNDDTIPQIGEGTQILSVSITPTTNASRIIVTVYVPAACGSIEDVTVALYQAGTANALAALVKALGLNGSTEFFFTSVLATGSTAAVTLSVRIGSASGGQWEVNGASGARKLGGVMRAYLTAVEYL